MSDQTDPHPDIDAVFFDVGGVILSSPFEAFSAYEERAGLPRDAIRTINSTNPRDNAWARLERNECTLEEFVMAFEAEGRALGFAVDARAVLACLDGEIRPAMLRALATIHGRFTTALLTNNVVGMAASGLADASGFADVLAHVDVVVESSIVGVRKPEVAFYELACVAAATTPRRVVFLDDLGVNLKPARAMGMRTIKVVDPDEALDELAVLLGIDLR